MAFLTKLSDLIWGPWLLGGILAVGLFYSLATGFFQIFGLPVWWRTTVGALLRGKGPGGEGAGRGVTRLQALSAALAATIGTGSIAGVATAIFFGGPGAVFWMWMSALVGMMTGCAEKTLAVRFREKDENGRWRGGPMVYMRDGLRLPGLAAVFSLFCVAETLTGGSLAQANSISAVLHTAFGANRLLVGVLLAAAVSLVLAGGIRRVGQVSELLVPVMAGLFILAGLAVLALRWRAVPEAFSQIIRYAFAPKAAAGGYCMGTALRYGVARGVFTNEAGLGMSAMAHACSDVEEPAEQGMWGIFEVFFATLVICTVTALVILTSGVYDPARALELLSSGAVPEGASGAPLTAAGFAAALGGVGESIVALCLVLFAFTSLLGAGYYGRRGVESLTKSRAAQVLFRAAFPVCIVLGSVGELRDVWSLVDIFNGLLAVPNLPALLLLAPEALRLLRSWLNSQKVRQKREVPGL